MPAAIKLEAGHVLDERYLLENVIGEGGMGTVFAARHLELGDIVAVKVLQSAELVNMNDEHRERFVREARLCAKIKNEHVVRIVDVSRGKQGSPPYIVMELLDGIDLGDLVRSLGRVRIPDAVDYVLQACEALAEAHALGIVHRDLKASNLHVSKRSDGSPLVKILDFGISKAQGDTDVSLTATSAVFGSPAYMSPEQIRSAKHVDHRTDVWALNVVLYELLTGELPFNGESAAAMLAAISADPYTPVRKHLPDAPVEIERAIHAAFVKDRDKRTPSVAAFASSIAPFAGTDVTARLAAIQRASQRSSSSARSLPAPAMPAPDAVAIPTPGRISDTMRISGDQDPTREGAPLARDNGTSAGGDVGHTDREMVVPNDKARATSAMALIAVATAVVLAVGVVVLVFVVRSRPPQERRGPESPPAPIAATAPTMTTVASGPSASAEPSAKTEVPWPSPSLDLPASPAPRKPSRTLPHPPTHPSAAPKPNHVPNTDQRE